ncbi:histone-like nucleoid-structuring protein Lsr2 [Mobilicoccus massiliensis]|uniref:histone-like nucleoid-structuring protein Lsr2 n=1 Tax=Mobilicoccus massiliensis TaxID=1522310 RepID=UPI00058CB5D4|nr:Lsr2 family protein [Mobilicoccus massiliensis]
MAQRVQVILVDDIDGGEATETVTFALDGVSYEIDLSEKNAARLRDSFSEWVGNARRAGGRKVTGRRGGASARREDLNEVREWGRANGFKVSDRGRVSGELQTAYDKAHGK